MAKRKMKKAAKRHSKKRQPRSVKITKLPKEALTQVVILRAKEGQQLLLEAELRALISPSRREEGCWQYDLHHAIDQPGMFLLHEVWESREHHTEHTKTPHFLRWNARKDALVASRESAFWQQLA
jgi:quinol monooxygenase YgiN